MTRVKIAVFSDSHGYMDLMVAAVEEEQPDRIFFLGDNLRDGRALARLYPQIPMELLRGNCDFGPGEDERILELEGVRFLLVHGHRQGAKSGTEGLVRAGRACGADMVCFGHTHQAVNLWDGTLPRLFNPGTAGGVRARRGYGILKVRDGRVEGWLK